MVSKALMIRLSLQPSPPSDTSAFNNTRFRPYHDFERKGLVRIAAEAAYLKVAVACVERVARAGEG